MENNDRIIKFLAYDKKVSIICSNTTYLVERARRIHGLSPTATAAFGRVLTITAIMGIEMKSIDDNLTIQLKGNGPIGNIVTVTNNFPKVRGYVQNTLVEIPLKEDGKIDVGNAVGKTGFLNIIKDIGLKDPYVGIVPLVSGEIAEDFTNYFATSEQKPTAIALGVLLNKDGVKTSGGYVMSPMPDATEEIINKLEENLKKIPSISKMLDEKLSLLDIAKKVTGDENVEIIEENIIPVYECNCSKEKVTKGLISIGKEELKDILEKDEKIETVCHFCNEKYSFDKEELIKIIEQI